MELPLIDNDANKDKFSENYVRKKPGVLTSRYNLLSEGHVTDKDYVSNVWVCMSPREGVLAALF